MDEASQNSFYEDDRPVSCTISEARGHLKDEGLLTFKSTCQQLAEETAEPIRNEQRDKDAFDLTVPVCDDQKCQLQVQQDIAHATSVSTSLPQEHRTVSSIEMCDERPSIADNFKNLKIISKEHQYFAECTTRLPLPLDKSFYNSYKSSKDDKGKLEASQDESYLDWNAPSHFKLMNNVPTGWPAIGVKCSVTENINTPHQSTLSLFTMVKQAHLLSEEQLAQIKEPELNEHYKHSYRATLKRSSPSREEFDSPAEKFAKAALDVEIENSSEYGEFFSQEETSDDCKKASRIYADQEVPVQDEDVTSNSTGQAMEVVDERMSGSPVSKKMSSFGEKPSFHFQSDDMKWLSSTEDHLHIGNAWLYEAPKKGPCTKSFCLKFFQKHHGHLLNVNSPEEEGLSTYGAAQVSSMNTEQGGGETRLTNQLGKNSELLEREQIMIITDEEDPSHNEVQVVLSQSPVTYNIACEYPPLPENTGLCSSLHAIDERALITCPLDDVDCSPLKSRKVLFHAEMLLYERKEVDDWVDQCDVFSPNAATYQDHESFSTSIPVKNLRDRSHRHAEFFDKIQLSDPKPGSLHATHSEAPPENMQTEGPMNQRENKITTNFFDQRNDDTNEIAPPGNGSVMEPEGKENKKEFNYVNQDSIKVGESSEMKEDTKSNNSHQDKSENFGAEIESKIIDLDGPQLLQFAMILVQGALNKSQMVPSCNKPLKRDEDNKCVSMATPAFLWKNAFSYQGQPASNEPGNKVDEDGEDRDADSKERPLHLIRPLPKTTCNRPLRLGLSKKYSHKRLHPYFKKRSNENRADVHFTMVNRNGEQ